MMRHVAANALTLLIVGLVALFGATVPPLPAIDNETLLVLLTGMLGLGGLRTFERVKGKA